MSSKDVGLKHVLDLDHEAALGTQVKLTYVGLQEKATPSVGIIPLGKAFDMSLFRKSRHSGINYGNDDVIAPGVCTLAASDYEKVYATAVTYLKKSGEMPKRPFLSISVAHVDPGVVGLEVISDRDQSEQLLRALVLDISPANRQARAILNALDTRVF